MICGKASANAMIFSIAPAPTSEFAASSIPPRPMARSIISDPLALMA
jgi:hypothetical protein